MPKNAVVVRRRAGSRPLSVTFPSPAVVIAPALVPCPSASALACCRCRRCRPRRLRTRPADCRRPPPPSPSRLPPPSELSLSCRSQFGIAVVDAAAAAAAANGDQIPPLISRSRRPANPLPAAVVAAAAPDGGGRARQIVGVRRRRRFLSAADTIVISRNLVDCCVKAICSQCFVATGDTVGNPAATKTGDTNTCHRAAAAASRREAPPGAWEVGVYFNCFGRGEPSNISTGDKLGPPSRQRRRHRQLLGSRDDN
jgi:hypothetical protein